MLILFKIFIFGSYIINEDVTGGKGIKRQTQNSHVVGNKILSKWFRILDDSIKKYIA